MAMGIPPKWLCQNRPPILGVLFGCVKNGGVPLVQMGFMPHLPGPSVAMGGRVVVVRPGGLGGL